MSQAEDEPRQINPFKVIRAGEDSVDGDENITFSDFRPTPVSSDDDLEDVVGPDPKEESAPEPASLPGSGPAPTTEPIESAKIAPTPVPQTTDTPPVVASESGSPSPTETS